MTIRSRAQDDIDALIAAFFSAFDNRDGQTPRLAAVLDCFDEHAVVAHAVGGELRISSVAEFAAPRIELLTGGTLVDFHESETGADTRVTGRLAARTSRYGKAGLLNGSRYGGTGTKLFQLVAAGARWRILSLAWTDDEA